MREPLVTFTVDGEPVPQGSMRSLGKGRPTIHGNAEKLEPWRATVAARAREAMLDAGHDGRLFAGPLRLDVGFVFGRPRSHFGTGRNAGRLKASAPVYCDKRPDLDKLVRAIGDALTGIVVVDDAAFVELIARKHYGSPAAFVAVEAVT